MKLLMVCDWCGKEFLKESAKISKHNFCCRRCLADFSSKLKNPNGYASLKDYTNISAHMTQLNSVLNPDRMNQETRSKIRNKRLTKGNGSTYSKYFSMAEHRVVAENILGRLLKAGEVVHHIDGDKRNNTPDNLMVLDSQSDHMKLHRREKCFWNGGDAE